MQPSALVLTAALAALTLAGCNRSEPAAPAETAAPAEKRYPITGEVLSADPARKILIVHHDEIPGYMPEMTMEFLVSAGDLAVIQPGMRIRAEMIPSDTGDFRLEKIWPDDRTAAAAVEAGTKALRQDTMIRGRGVYREVGEQAPEFVLYDQNGTVVQSARFRGKQVMLNFIFTRCPVATMCPASTMKMMASQQLAKEAGVPNIEFVSITLDPAYDTPGVLKEYADVRGIDTTNFSFLTGPESAIKDLLAQFGVITAFEGNLINHTLATVLIDANGRIIHRADGSVWEPKDFVAKMKR
ncbi:MAG: SCO family protein [Opitutaceae bacterium]|nr:SCO family protein [Opitutaceae bacterium]